MEGQPGLLGDAPAHGRGWNCLGFKVPSDPKPCGILWFCDLQRSASHEQGEGRSLGGSASPTKRGACATCPSCTREVTVATLSLCRAGATPRGAKQPLPGVSQGVPAQGTGSLPLPRGQRQERHQGQAGLVGALTTGGESFPHPTQGGAGSLHHKSPQGDGGHIAKLPSHLCLTSGQHWQEKKQHFPITLLKHPVLVNIHPHLALSSAARSTAPFHSSAALCLGPPPSQAEKTPPVADVCCDIFRHFPAYGN